jgi:hypothetical protein
MAQRTPLLASPDRERDLVLKDASGIRGRPYGRFRKWHLNEYGFRGPDIERTPPKECTRVMVLGASEMFGLYESEGKEFAAQLDDDLKQVGRYEVVNAAMPGMTARRMLAFWKSWASQFKPQIAVIYASPMFYLDEQPPALRPVAAASFEKTDSALARPQSRLLGRWKDLYRSFPRFVKRWREDWVIRQQAAGKPEEWFFRTVPQERLAQFIDDLRQLIAAIRADGARPILLTHANRSAAEPTANDLDDARGMRMFFARATPETILAFERAAARSERELGREEEVEVIDLEAALNGKRECFADLVHFTDEGAAMAARLVRQRLQDVAPAGR